MGVLEQIKEMLENAKLEESRSNDGDRGRILAFEEVLDLFKDAKEFNCGLYAQHEAVIKGKYDKRGETVELPQSYKLIIVEVEN